MISCTAGTMRGQPSVFMISLVALYLAECTSMHILVVLDSITALPIYTPK